MKTFITGIFAIMCLIACDQSNVDVVKIGEEKMAAEQLPIICNDIKAPCDIKDLYDLFYNHPHSSFASYEHLTVYIKGNVSEIIPNPFPGSSDYVLGENSCGNLRLGKSHNHNMDVSGESGAYIDKLPKIGLGKLVRLSCQILDVFEYSPEEDHVPVAYSEPMLGNCSPMDWTPEMCARTRELTKHTLTFCSQIPMREIRDGCVKGATQSLPKGYENCH